MQLFQFRNALGRLVGVPVWRPTLHAPKPRERAHKPLFTFLWELGQVGGLVKAKSRCDARSMIKRQMGIPIKQRLPIGVRIDRINTGRA